MNETAEPAPECVRVLALPPYDYSSMAFRAAVYTNPDAVRFRIRVDTVGDVDLRVTDMSPGTTFSVRGPVERPWLVLLTCEEAGWYTVSRAPVQPPDVA